VEADGSVRLSLITYQSERPIHLDDRRIETVNELADELIRMAADVTRATAETVRLSTVLPTQLSTRVRNPETRLAETMWPVAIPSLRGGLEPGSAVADYQAGAVIGIPEHVQRDDRLASLTGVFRQLDRQIPGDLQPVPVTIIGSTDATAITLVRSYDLMPIWNIPEIDDAWRVYAQNAGTRQARLVEPPTLATVFAAERAALEYERRLEYLNLLNQDFHRLHPLIVFALQRPEVVEAYGLALAAGWLTVRDGVARLMLPGSPDEIPLRYEPRGDLPPLVAGLLQAGRTWQPDSEVWERLQEAFTPPGAEITAAWNAFLDHYRQVEEVVRPAVYYCEQGHPLTRGQRFCTTCGRPAPEENYTAPAPLAAPKTQPYAGEPAAVQDLVAVAVLATYRRLVSPEKWQEIVMPAARWA
jgi:hypothetical protein